MRTHQIDRKDAINAQAHAKHSLALKHVKISARKQATQTRAAIATPPAPPRRRYEPKAIHRGKKSSSWTALQPDLLKEKCVRTRGGRREVPHLRAVPAYLGTSNADRSEPRRTLPRVNHLPAASSGDEVTHASVAHRRWGPLRVPAAPGPTKGRLQACRENKLRAYLKGSEGVAVAVVHPHDHCNEHALIGLVAEQVEPSAQVRSEWTAVNTPRPTVTPSKESPTNARGDKERRPPDRARRREGEGGAAPRGGL